MTNLSPDPVNNPADNHGKPSPNAEPTPSPDILSRFEPQSYPLSRREKIEVTLQWVIGAAIVAALVWAIWG